MYDTGTKNRGYCETRTLIAFLDITLEMMHKNISGIKITN